MRLRFITLESKPVLLEEYSLHRNCAQPSMWSLDSSWGGLGKSTEPCKCFCVDDMASPGKNLELFHVLSHLCIVCKKSCGLHSSFSKLCGLSLSGQQLPHCAVADPGSQKSLKDRKCFPALCLFLGGGLNVVLQLYFFLFVPSKISCYAEQTVLPESDLWQERVLTHCTRCKVVEGLPQQPWND